MSTEFYNINAKDFYERTVSLDIKNLYEPFLERIKKKAHILIKDIRFQLLMPQVKW